MDHTKKYFLILHPATDEDRLVSGPSSGDWSGRQLDCCPSSWTLLHTRQGCRRQKQSCRKPGEQSADTFLPDNSWRLRAYFASRGLICGFNWATEALQLCKSANCKINCNQTFCGLAPWTQVVWLESVKIVPRVTELLSDMRGHTSQRHTNIDIVCLTIA